MRVIITKFRVNYEKSRPALVNLKIGGETLQLVKKTLHLKK